jgi:hypothetical protein
MKSEIEENQQMSQKPDEQQSIKHEPGEIVKQNMRGKRIHKCNISQTKINK